ncbi:MAG: EcoRV family type II restriction endonuclease [Synergistaceae bacterium]|nr:EcoRV family type II restriction endonuclease [Synergistaceae bacterium]
MPKTEKETFFENLKTFAAGLADHVVCDEEWTMRGFIDIFKNVYPLTTDSKVLSKILELHLLPELFLFAERFAYVVEPAEKQNWYPDLTFISRENHDIKFAVDLKTTYRDEKKADFCNGFTLGSHGEYFTNRDSTKNIQYPYSHYSGHFCIGIIYSRNVIQPYASKIYSVDEISVIPAVIKKLIFFAAEKWRIASDKSGSGNTANIGSIKRIENILSGNGVFARAGEDIFNDYWVNFGRISVRGTNGKYKKLSSLSEYLRYRGLPESLLNREQ